MTYITTTAAAVRAPTTSGSIFSPLNGNSLSSPKSKLSFSESYYWDSTKADPLAVSCMIFRHAKAGNHAINTDLTCDSASELLTDEDIVLAETIRRYYSRKLMLAALCDKEFTSFRQSLSEFLTGDACSSRVIDGIETYTWSSKMTGLIHKLPRLYEYDMILEDLASNHTPACENSALHGPTKLSLVKKIKSHRKSEPHYEYWFKNENQNLAKISLPIYNSPLLPLWENHISVPEVTLLVKLSSIKQLDACVYHSVSIWELLPR